MITHTGQSWLIRVNHNNGQPELQQQQQQRTEAPRTSTTSDLLPQVKNFSRIPVPRRMTTNDLRVGGWGPCIKNSTVRPPLGAQADATADPDAAAAVPWISQREGSGAPVRLGLAGKSAAFLWESGWWMVAEWLMTSSMWSASGWWYEQLMVTWWLNCGVASAASWGWLVGMNGFHGKLRLGQPTAPKWLSNN